MTSRFPVIFLSLAVLVMGYFFFRVVQPYVLPLVFACVLAVLCWPLYQWITRLFGGHDRIAAAATTALVLLVVVAPLGLGLVLGTVQLIETASDFTDEADMIERLENIADPSEDTSLDNRLEELRSRFSSKEIAQIQEVISNAGSSFVRSVVRRTMDLVANTFTFVVGMIVLALGLYYFLADNKQILQEVRRLSPLDDRDDRELAENFVRVCRGVLLGNVFAAGLQALLNMIGFAAAGISTFWLLGLVTFFLSMIPFLGAAAVWGSVCLWLLLEERYLAAGLLALYGTLIVSSIDNVIRAFALRDSARIHPLLALISILGALQLVGVWGIIVGPVVTALFYALVNILHNKTNVDKPAPVSLRNS